MREGSALTGGMRAKTELDASYFAVVLGGVVTQARWPRGIGRALWRAEGGVAPEGLLGGLQLQLGMRENVDQHPEAWPIRRKSRDAWREHVAHKRTLGERGSQHSLGDEALLEPLLAVLVDVQTVTIRHFVCDEAL